MARKPLTQEQKDAYKAKRAEWLRNNPTKKRDYARKAAAKATPEQKALKKAKRDAYRSRPEVRAKINELAKLRRKRPEVRTKEASKLDVYHESINGRARVLMASVKNRSFSVECDLDYEWFVQRLSAGVCEVTGLPFNFKRRTGRRNRPWNPSVDRKDPTKGYTKDNCQLVCWAYNTAKGGWTHEDVVKLCRAVLERYTPNESM